MTPRVTVLMPVYNGEKHLNEAIGSILSQSFSDFEFLIINDGSTDNSVDIIRSFHDKRIRLISNKKNSGVATSLNQGIEKSRSEYIVRMDADDISLPGRIKKQVDYMDANPEIGISGAWIEHIIKDNKNKVIWKFPKDYNMIRMVLLFASPMGHNTVIIRKKLLIDNKLFYRHKYETAEDHDLWARASFVVKMSNLEDVLVLYRRHNQQVGIKNAVRQRYVVNLIIMDQLKKLGLNPTREELDIHNSIWQNINFNSTENIINASVWLEKLSNANAQTKLFPISEFNKFLAWNWFQVCTSANNFNIWHIKAYYRSDLSRTTQSHFKVIAKLINRYCRKRLSVLKKYIT